MAVIWKPKSQNYVAGFEAQIRKPPTLVLRLNQETHHRLGFEAQLRN
jgi:hypothetical protein